jgi:hypothetical protein
VANVKRRLDRSTAATVTEAETFVLVVDDPDATMRLVAVDGPMRRDAVAHVDVAMSEIHPGVALHLDLNAVTTWSPETLAALEEVFDRVESNGTRLRVVGIDPRLPALPRPLGS